MTTLGAAIVSARTLVGDAATSNLARFENMNNPDVGNTINGTNTVFSVVNYPIVPSVVALNQDGTITTAFTENDPIGVITTNTPPASTLLITYYYYLMSDSDWTEFITWGLERLNLSTGVPSADVPNVTEGLLNALKTYAGAAWATRMSTQTGLWYNQRLQERQEDRDQVSRKYTKLADQLTKDADGQRDGFYKGSGTQYKAAFQIVNHPPRSYTPRR